MTLPWSGVDDPTFCDLIAEMRGADVTIVNLEAVIHSHRGYAQAHSGGTWTASPPAIAHELAWAGVDMVAHANNHTFDYGSEGVVETLEHVTAAGLKLAGSGKDMQAARAPATVTAKGKWIALLAMAASFVPYGKASRSRPDHRGRPGLNPLALTRGTTITVTPGLADVMRRFDLLLRRDQERYQRTHFRRFGVNWEIGAELGMVRGQRPVLADRTGNLAAIAEASAVADVVVVSIHAHEQSQWLRDFARDAVAAGAGVVLVHGPHEVRGIAFVADCPVFYGLGDFVYQAAQVAALPSDAYEAAGLDEGATPADLVRVATPVAALVAKRETFEGCAALLRYDNAKRPVITLLPLDLQYGGDATVLGRPRLAGRELGEKIIADIAKHSRKCGTAVIYCERTNTGVVKPV
jgi:poly-gamma-glutamate synthesis protein (capsule biosynthesis protein)